MFARGALVIGCLCGAIALVAFVLAVITAIWALRLVISSILVVGAIVGALSYAIYCYFSKQ